VWAPLKDGLIAAGPRAPEPVPVLWILEQQPGRLGWIRPDAKANEVTDEEENEMAYGVAHQFAGGTKEQYDASIAAVHPSDGRLPDGQLFHAAGPSAGGWTIIAVHDSQESWERFRDGVLIPRMAQGIEGGFTAPPQETTFEVYNQATS